MILTDEEIMSIPSFPWGKSTDYARAVEARIMEKLAEQKPVVWMQSTHLKMFETQACGSSMMLAKCSLKQAQSDFIPLYLNPPVSKDKLDGRKGFSLLLEREQWGAVIDGLILERDRSAQRKAANSESTSDAREQMCVEVIKGINAASDAAMKEQGK